MANGLVEHVFRVELPGKVAARPREPLCQLPRAALALVQVAALERSPRRRRHLAGKLELVVPERSLPLEEDEHEPGSARTRLDQRHGQQRVAPGRGGGGSEPVAEPSVVEEPARGQDLAAAGAVGELGSRDAEMRCEGVRELVTAHELELGAEPAEHRGRVPAERLGRGLRDRVQRLLLRQWLAQNRGDPEEAALDLGLACALLVRLRVPERNRREAGERFDQPEVGELEAAGLARADAEDAANLPEREDRRVHHLGELGVRGGRRRLLGLAESPPQHGLAGRDRLPDRARHRDRAPDLALRDPQHGAADELRAARLQCPAVGRVGIHQRPDLLDEAVDHDVEAKVARQRLAGLEQRLLLGEPAIAVPEQPGRVEGDRRLARDRLEQRDLVGPPGPRNRAVDGEDAEQPVLGENRCRQHGMHASFRQLANVSEHCVLELGGREDVGHGDRAARPRREVHDRELGGVAERRHARVDPTRRSLPSARRGRRGA